MKNQKGITLVALSITIIIFTVILATITFSSVSSMHLRRLNNMYADINAVQSRLDSYVLKNKGKLPVYSDQDLLIDSIHSNIESSFTAIMTNITLPDIRRNPNDDDVYKVIKFVDTSSAGGVVNRTNLLGTFTLNNYSLDNAGNELDFYLVNNRSHQVYYCTYDAEGRVTGVQASEDEQDIRYSIPFENVRNVQGILTNITGV